MAASEGGVECNIGLPVSFGDIRHEPHQRLLAAGFLASPGYFSPLAIGEGGEGGKIQIVPSLWPITGSFAPVKSAKEFI